MTTLSGPREEIGDYLREIGQHPLLTSEEEIGLSRQMLEGGRETRERARDRLIEAILRLVVSIARCGHGLSLPYITQEGNIGLQTGLEKAFESARTCTGGSARRSRAHWRMTVD